ncbi:hypothetical protein U876_23940 [Aeromonas hydrophila NJ-35]|uniref:hypothetical protein n=1 Tax=Aeromonas TaxID=642 RepID=UPI0006409D00|nr:MULTISPECIES: hypothetical protein [Aeromonas]AKJ37120.1 hypothetical protein U876_23940 [Aeromonas hydrophila NJ-35]HDK8695671.1 hypothetical protein [Aeromonas hydrophila]
MYYAFKIFNITSAVIVLAVIGIFWFQQRRLETITLSSPSWLILLMSPMTVFPIIPILFFLWATGSTYLYGATGPHIFALIFSSFCCYAYQAILHKGARVIMQKPVRELMWWLDYSGNLHAHLDNKSHTGMTCFSERKKKVLSLLADIEDVGPFGRPIVLKTPLKLDYLSTRLAKQGWKIERYPATRCPWIVKVALSIQRGTLQIPVLSNSWRIWRIWRNWRNWRLPTSREWRELALMHHAVLFPPSYSGEDEPQATITPPTVSQLKD